MIKAFIFDMDGVLVDTQTTLDVDEFLFLRKITNNKWTRRHQKTIHGMSLEDVYRLLIIDFGFKMNKETFLNKYNEVNKIIYQKKALMTRGALDFLRQVSGQKYKIALASSASHKLINVILRRFNLKKYFDIVVSSDDVYGKGKPEPDIFLTAARRLSVPQEQCIVIEDSANGVKAAKRAGMYCVGYRGQETSRNQQKLALADIIISTFENINVNFLVSQILKKAPKSIEKIAVGNDIFYFKLSEMVNKSDYYSDFLLEELLRLLNRIRTKQLNMLEIGTGRGYLSIILAKKYPNIKRVVATDIDHHAFSLARTNIMLNSLEEKIELRKGSLFHPIRMNEKFDLIIAVPPQIPITRQKLMELNLPVPYYHFTTSVGGSNGQTVIRKLVRHVSRYLSSDGFFALVHADFSHPERTIKQLTNHHLKLYKITKKRKLLQETTLTKLLKEHIEKQDYLFRKNTKGDYYFNLVTILAYKPWSD